MINVVVCCVEMCLDFFLGFTSFGVVCVSQFSVFN